MRIPTAIWRITKELARHLLRRPIAGVVAAARTDDGRWLLVRRADTGRWAFVGGTLEWGETLSSCIARELVEETGARLLEVGPLVGVYSDPARDPRFHAVTVVVHATVSQPDPSGINPLEIAAVRLFTDDELPSELSHGMDDMISDARSGRQRFE